MTTPLTEVAAPSFEGNTLDGKPWPKPETKKARTKTTKPAEADDAKEEG